MANQAPPLSYKGHPLRRKDNLIYYGTMAEKYIIMLQVLSSKKQGDLTVADKVSVQLQFTDPRPEEPGPGGQEEREGQSLRRDGRGRRLAGPGAGRKVTKVTNWIPHCR